MDAGTKARLLVLFILLCIFFLLGYRNGAINLVQIKQQHRDLTEEKAFYEEQLKELKDQKEKLLHDKTYIEKNAREKHNMVLPGEKVYRVVEE